MRRVILFPVLATGLAAVAACSTLPTMPAGPPPERPPAPQPERLVPSRLAAVWAAEADDKVPREDRRVSHDRISASSGVWTGSSVSLFAARNEVVAFVLVLEAGDAGAEKVSVDLPELAGSTGVRLRSGPTSADAVFDWRERNIELFYVRYLRIEGLSKLTWEHYDERHIPERFRRKHDARGIGTGGWKDRPDHGKHYPDIAVPIELHPAFTVPPRSSQCVLVDVYVPKGAPSGTYSGTITIREDGKPSHRIPVELAVRAFALPDVPAHKVMIQMGYGDVNLAYLGQKFPSPGVFGKASEKVRDRHFLLAHRHKLSLIDANEGPDPWSEDAPRPGWLRRLDGTLFTPEHGYDGPGVGAGNGVFSIGTYGSWGWQNEGREGMWAHTDAWASWFDANAPGTEVFLYLIDESTDFEKIEKWARWMADNPGPGKTILSMATVGLVDAVAKTPSLRAPTASLKVGRQKPWEEAARALLNDPNRRLWMYNGAHPACGSLALEDDGVALRQIGWTAFKKKVDRWFFWESTYYNNFQGGMGQTNVFRRAHTFGASAGPSESLGETGWNYTNGDGVLFYPGTDTRFPDDSYGVMGPFASMRLKYMRRGVQDVDYLTMAAKIAPKKVEKIVEELIPKVLWDYGVDSQADPTYKHTALSWPNRPERWEAARRRLADIIEGAAKR